MASCGVAPIESGRPGAIVAQIATICLILYNFSEVDDVARPGTASPSLVDPNADWN